MELPCAGGVATRANSMAFCVCLQPAMAIWRQMQIMPVKKPPASSPATAPETSTGQPAGPEESVDDRDEMDHAYAAVLENLLETIYFPTGPAAGTH